MRFFLEARKLAIEQLALHAASCDAVERVLLGRTHDVSAWLRSGYNELARRPQPLTDEQCLHATNLVCGWAFAEKKWVEFFVDKLNPIEFSEDAFDHLVLPARQKSVVKALVESHMKEQEEGGFDDVIKGKGKGLISILHGPPGVGKTLT